jgi:clan AA aspartic protease
MITGIFDRNEARIQLQVQGPRTGQRIEAAIDTGFTGALTLPPKLIAKLRLPWCKLDRSILADGSECTYDVFVASVLWDGRIRRILIDEADVEPLVGIRLMKDHELRVQVRDCGRVTLRRLTR